MPEFVKIECPVCGAAGSVLKSAYLGGWCIGPKERRHKPRNYRKVGVEDVKR